MAHHESQSAVASKADGRHPDLALAERTAVEPNIDRIFDLIQQKTAETRELVDRHLDEFTAKVESALKHSTQFIRQSANCSAVTFQQTTKESLDGVRKSRNVAERYVRHGAPPRRRRSVSASAS